MAHTDLRQDKGTVCKVVDQFGRKVLTSGYSLHQTRKIVMDGIRGWDRKVKRMLEDNGGKLFRTNRESLKLRIKKKTLGRTSWYKSKIVKKAGAEPSKEDQDMGKKVVKDKQERTKYNKKKGVEDNKNLNTAAVLFVDNTKEGGLARSIREVLSRLEDILGYKVKVVERSGTPLKQMFPLSKIGEGQSCGRTDCITCTQDSRGETLPPCKKRSVLYENICLDCNPDILEDKGNRKVPPPKYPPSIYIGESSRQRCKKYFSFCHPGIIVQYFLLLSRNFK